jgi:hypothetical protein
MLPFLSHLGPTSTYLFVLPTSELGLRPIFKSTYVQDLLLPLHFVPRHLASAFSYYSASASNRLAALRHLNKPRLRPFPPALKLREGDVRLPVQPTLRGNQYVYGRLNSLVKGLAYLLRKLALPCSYLVSLATSHRLTIPPPLP